MSTTAIIGLIIIVIVLYLMIGYNRLVRLRNNVKNSFADIDVQMKMRFDLIENLVNTVKGYATHEKETLEKLTAARTQFLGATTQAEKFKADDMGSGALKSLFAVAENYPDLKASTNFLQLQNELADIENKIAATRRYYNSSINEYNSSTQSFPSSIIAKMFGFQQDTFFTVTDEKEKAVPQVKF